MMSIELIRLAECPVCLGRLIPAAVMCINGHAICQKCQEQVNVCPTCRGSFSNIIKNTLLNQMLEYIPVPCKYRELGCETETIIGEMIEHEKYCYFREDKCCGCHKVVSFPKLSDHFIDHMNDTVDVCGNQTKKIGITSAFSENQDTLLNMKRFPSAYTIRYIHDEKAVFVQRFFQNWENKTVLFSLQYIGKMEEVNKYLYEIKINQGRFSTFVDASFFTCMGHCMPYCYGSSDWKDKEKVVKLDLKQIFSPNNVPEEFNIGVSVLKI